MNEGRKGMRYAVEHGAFRLVGVIGGEAELEMKREIDGITGIDGIDAAMDSLRELRSVAQQMNNYEGGWDFRGTAGGDAE